MNKIFRKAITVLGSVALIGATVGAAAAASYPAPFTSNTAIVVGANAAPSDTINGASLIADNLNAASTTSTTLVGAVGVTEDQVILGSTIVAGKITATLTDSKIPSLMDTKISWDDGGASGSDDWNVHEEILVGSMAINTTLTDNDFTGLALTNDQTLEYRYVFETAMDNITNVGATTADDLYLTILGKQYEIDGMTDTSVTVVTSEEVSVSVGESVVVGGKTFTVDDVFSADAQINNELIASGSTKKIDGMRVKVKSIGYHSNSPELSKVILQIGSDISKTYSTGEEYIGEDEDDPTWTWSIANLDNTANAYIGIKYNQKETRDTDNVVYEGGSYIFPENFAEVRFDGLTAGIAYEDFRLYFDASEDLWNSTDLTSTANTTDSPVLIIEAVDGRKDSIKLETTDNETNKAYIRWVGNNTANRTEGLAASYPYGSVEVFYSDVNSDVSDSIRPRYAKTFNSTATGNGTIAIADGDIGDIIVGDTTIGMNVSVTGGQMNLTLTDEGAGQNITLNIGGDAILGNLTGNLKWFGGIVEATDKEDGLATDMIIGGTNVGTFDNDVITTQGIIVRTPEGNLDNDEVIISVPNDRVYATISIVAGGDATTTGEAGVMTVKDTEVATVAGKNLIVVGGSAINSVAAELLKGAFSEGAFTTATGVGAGQFLIQSFSRSGKTALLVAGYEGPETAKAVTALLNSDVDTTVGKKYVSEATTVSSTDLVAVV